MVVSQHVGVRSLVVGVIGGGIEIVSQVVGVMRIRCQVVGVTRIRYQVVGVTQVRGEVVGVIGKVTGMRCQVVVMMKETQQLEEEEV